MTAESVRDARDPEPRSLPGQGKYWVQPVLIAVGFTLFIVYSFWSVAIFTSHHVGGPYLSPYYSPVIAIGWWPLSSGLLVAWVPLGFRGTCYYYRKAYFRAYFLDPQACAIREPAFRQHYTGETRFPWVLNNSHRFFLYLALVILGFLWYDTINAFYYKGGFYLGVGAALMLANVVLLSFYTFSCHALRHLVGGSVDCFSCVRAGHVRHGLWGAVSAINPYHGAFAWGSLISVATVDIYIRVVSSVGGCFGTHFGC